MIRVLLPLALLGSGMAAGGLMISALGGAPLLLSLPTDRYVPVHKFLVTRFEPFMPLMLCTGLATDAVLIFVTAPRVTRALAGSAAVLLAAALIVAVTKNVPINRWVSRLDVNALPPDWESIDPRIRWRNWNLVRTALVVTALLANVVAVAVAL